jgi:hypothetical protein
MNSDWKMNRPNAKPAIFDRDVEPHRQAEQRRHGGGDDDSRPVAGATVDGAADGLLPQQRGELLVRARPRLLVRQDIEEQPERTHIERDQDEAPLHHVRFGIVGELVIGDVGRRRAGHDEPGDQEEIVGLGDHGFMSEVGHSPTSEPSAIILPFRSSSP